MATDLKDNPEGFKLRFEPRHMNNPPKRRWLRPDGDIVELATSDFTMIDYLRKGFKLLGAGDKPVDIPEEVRPVEAVHSFASASEIEYDAMIDRVLAVKKYRENPDDPIYDLPSTLSHSEVKRLAADPQFEERIVKMGPLLDAAVAGKEAAKKKVEEAAKASKEEAKAEELETPGGAETTAPSTGTSNTGTTGTTRDRK